MLFENALIGNGKPHFYLTFLKQTKASPRILRICMLVVQMHLKVLFYDM